MTVDFIGYRFKLIVLFKGEFIVPKSRPNPSCEYVCSGGFWYFVGGDPGPGETCPLIAGTCSASEENAQMFLPPVPIAQNASRSLAANTGEYLFNMTTKMLQFRGGSCSDGKHFKPTFSLRELAQFDADAAELAKSMAKNKKIGFFSIVLKAQDMENKNIG